MSNSELLKRLEDMEKLVKKHEKLLRFQHEQIKCLVASIDAERGSRRELRADLSNQGEWLSALTRRVNNMDTSSSTDEET